jgi:peptidoglycan/LPS O-acetylase OafA/YrhL
MQYRREIDGLRAVAVVPVILYHAGIAPFGGGYVGVDVFFVVSGYLITGILLDELSRGDFSLLRFYERRARRILPALFVVMAVSVPFGWYWMRPDQLEDFGLSIAATSLFASNVLYAQQSGYFAPAAELKPLLHTWSLAVEEQYYLIFPLLLMAVWRAGRCIVVGCLVVLALASLAMCEIGLRAAPSDAFYLIPFRAWELLAGSLVAFHQAQAGQKQHSGLALLGLAMICAAVFAFDDMTPMPGLFALLPVGGTVLVIAFAAGKNAAARLLGQPLLVGTGLVSYGAYLWHNPILAFARIRSVAEPALPVMIGLVALTFGLAVLTVRVIEMPVRHRTFAPLATRRRVFAASAVATVLMVVVGVGFDRMDGAPLRIAPNGKPWSELAVDGRLAPNPGLGFACGRSVEASAADPACRTGNPPRMLLWGDSYAMHLAQALQSSHRALPFVQMTKSQCAPILGIAPDRSETRWSNCIAFNDAVLGWLRETPSVEIVVMSSPYNFRRAPMHGMDGVILANQNDDDVLAAMRRTADVIRDLGKTPVFVSPPPNPGRDLGHCLAQSAALGRSLASCDFEQAEYSSDVRDAYRLLSRLSVSERVTFLPDLMCRDGRCAASREGTFLYRDQGHLSQEGSRRIGQDDDLLGRILDPRPTPAAGD